nr:roundabout homolog 1-like [Cherax quadricarinatus]
MEEDKCSHIMFGSVYRYFSLLDSAWEDVTQALSVGQYLLITTTFLRILAVTTATLSLFPYATNQSHFLALAGSERGPRIVEHPKSIVVPRGDPATLNCAAEGSPEPKITWFRDGVVVTTSQEDPRSHRVVFPSGSLFFLSIKQGKKESDAGVYYCVATNAVGRAASTNATLTIAMLREEFRTVPQDVAAASGDRAEILCVPPRGHPPPDLSWTRNGHPIALKEEAERIKVENSIGKEVTRERNTPKAETS